MRRHIDAGWIFLAVPVIAALLAIVGSCVSRKYKELKAAEASMVSGAGDSGFCGSRFHPDAAVEMVSEAIAFNNGQSVAHSTQGFQCVLSLKDAPGGKCPETMIFEKESPTNGDRCVSKAKFDLKELCANNELSKYWEAGSPILDICSE